MKQSRLVVQLVRLGTLLAWLVELGVDSDPYRFLDPKTSCVAVLLTVKGRRRAVSFEVSSSCNAVGLRYCTNDGSEAVRAEV